MVAHAGAIEVVVDPLELECAESDVTWLKVVVATLV